MDNILTSDTFLSWIARQSESLARKTKNKGDPFPELWGVAVEALEWLNKTSPEDRKKVLQLVKRLYETGFAENVIMPTDEHETQCLKTLLQWIIDPPLVL